MTQTPQDTPAGAKGSKVESNVVDLATVPARLKRFDRLMGIDLGTKTIGLALSDVERSLASPLETIARRKFTLDVEAMLKLAAKYEVAVFVIGLPLKFSVSREEGIAVGTSDPLNSLLGQKRIELAAGATIAIENEDRAIVSPGLLQLGADSGDNLRRCIVPFRGQTLEIEGRPAVPLDEVDDLARQGSTSQEQHLPPARFEFKFIRW